LRRERASAAERRLESFAGWLASAEHREEESLVETAVLVVFVLVSMLLTLAIILQPGKGGGMGGLAGGGGPAGGVFGARGAVPFLAKATVYLGITFGLLVILIAKLNPDGSRIDEDTMNTEGTTTTGDTAPVPAPAGEAAPTGAVPAPAPAPAGEAAPTPAPAPAPAGEAAPAPVPAPAPAPQ
jgi:protein translocase SecG subunit